MSASPNFDGVSDSRTLTATAEADSSTLGCVLGLSSNTVFASFGGSAVTIARLRYASRYVEMISDDDRSSRITFGSTDTTVLLVSGAGRRQPQQNSPNLTPLQVCSPPRGCTPSTVAVAPTAGGAVPTCCRAGELRFSG